jgi:outer membrane protein assembly factor BamB
MVSFMGGLTAVISVSTIATGDDWPQWRGPNRDGVSTETGLLKAWPAGGPKLLWKATGIGGGFSSVAVVKGRIFTMGDNGDSSFVYALDAAGGKVVWSAKVGKPGGGGGYPGPRCTSTVDGDLVFALGQHGDLVCLDAATGQERWRKSLAKDFSGQVGGWEYSESPLVDGDKLVCTPGGDGGAVVALNKKTGDTLWRTKDFKDRAEYSSIVIAELGGTPQYVQFTGASVVGIGPDDGRLLWHATRHGSTAVIPTPICHENHVYVTSGYGIGCNLFKVSKAASGFNADQVYANKVMVNHHGGVVRVGDYLYGYSDGKGWVCQNFKTGEAVWEEKGKLGKGSLACADGHLYLRSESGKGTVLLIEASPQGFKEKGRFDQPERSQHNSWAHPVVANGKLYLRDQDILLCYDVKQ